MFNRTKKKRVFCANCRYVDINTRAVIFCEHPNNKVIKYNYFESYIIRKQWPEKINKHNNCKNYRGR